MRDIKFRAWDIKLKVWVFGINDFAYDEDKCQLNMSAFFLRYGNGTFDKDSLNQFTGLTDKNSVDIYEGDILSCYPDDFEFSYTKVVEWDNNKCELGITTNGRSGVILSDRAKDSYIVIGNIHENIELVKD